MEKISGYIGLFVTGVLAFSFLYPQKPNLFFDRTNITPFDHDGISILLQQNDDRFKLLLRIERYSARCPEGATTPIFYCYRFKPDLNEIISLQHYFEEHSKGFSEELRRHLDKQSGDDNLIFIQAKAVATYPKILPRFRRSYVTTVWLIHIVFIAIISLMIYWRRALGKLLISIIFVPLRLLFIGAKKIHGKV